MVNEDKKYDHDHGCFAIGPLDPSPKGKKVKKMLYIWLSLNIIDFVKERLII